MDDVFHSVSMVMNVDPEEIAKIVHDYINRGIVSDYDRLNCPKPPIYIGPAKVKSLKERLEESTMHADCEFCVKRDICTRDVPKPCRYRYTEEERIADQASDFYGCIFTGMYLPKTYQKKEENEMKPTSVWTIENIDDISITQDGNEISLLLKNRDDLTKITLIGDAIKNHNDNFITTLKIDMEENAKTMYEQDQKIRELEEENEKLRQKLLFADAMSFDDYLKLKEENKNLKKHIKRNADNFMSIVKRKDELKKELAFEKAANEAQQLQQVKRDKKELTGMYERLDNRYKGLLKDFHQLQDKLDLERATNEAQHKFIREYAGKGTEVQFNYVVNESDNEVSYVIVDKKTYDEKPNINLHGKDFTPDELVDRVLELEEENDRFKKQLHAVQLMLDNFRKDHEDILKTQREKHEDEVEQLNKLLTLYEKRLDELIKEKKNLIEENENLKKAYDILDKTLDKSQKACNKWYEKWVKMQSEQDGHTKLQEEKIADNVNHPSHYTGKYECIDVMQDVFGDEATNDFCLCNAFKYIWRARKKNGLEDVKKAVWYLNKYIEEAEKDGVPKGK